MSVPGMAFSISSCIYLFFSLSQLVTEQRTLTIDHYIFNLLISLKKDLTLNHSSIFTEVLRDITSIGSVSVLFLISLIFSIYFYISKNRRAAIIIFFSYSSSLILSALLKGLFDRVRPNLITEAPEVFTTSFPSSHATQSMAVFLTIGLFLARSENLRTARGYIYFCAVFIPVMVGASRLILGVHWPSDVLAGWLLGITIGLTMVSISQFWSRKAPMA